MPSKKIPEDVNNHELDPLLDALLIHLPAPGDYFSLNDRQLWLQMCELSFQLVYSNEPEPEPTEHPHGG
jgi:hypothetical protein